jgi:hypothetical protein
MKENMNDKLTVCLKCKPRDTTVMGRTNKL